MKYKALPRFLLKQTKKYIKLIIIIINNNNENKKKIIMITTINTFIIIIMMKIKIRNKKNNKNKIERSIYHKKSLILAGKGKFLCSQAGAASSSRNSMSDIWW